MADDVFSREEGFDWEAAGDLTAMPEKDLQDELTALSEEERALSLRLELLRGRAGLIRAELAGRGLATVSAEELARVLLGDGPGRGGI